jgi:hypothetical protein
MDKRLRILSFGAFGVVLALVLAIAALYTFSAPRHIVALDTPIRQDDFVYTVTGIGRTPTISNPAASATAKGEFYIVTIRVDNHAKRVSFVWDERIPHIVDARGHRWDVTPQGQTALDAALKPHFSIPAGDSRTFEAVFDVPATIDRPALVFDNGILMGDVFNLVAYRRIGVQLY